MRVKLLGLTFVVAIALAAVVPPFAGPGQASAHVHGITPLLGLGCVVDNSITGADATNGTPAAAANGGPITGLIPRDTGNASLAVGDGGFGATTGPC